MPKSNNVAIVVFEPETKKPILIDEYGVPMFDGDKYWWVANKDLKKTKAFTAYSPTFIHINKKTNIELKNNRDCKIFASLESAERWIKENKPKQPMYIDHENGDEFYKGDEVFLFALNNCKIITVLIDDMDVTAYTNRETFSKIYKTRQKCEIALANFILNKYK